MTQPPLAFTIVKTVVTARDEGQELPPSVAVAWEMLRGELGVAARAAEASVTWGPEHGEEIRRLIDGVGDCFVNDAALEREFAVLLDDAARVSGEAAAAAPRGREGSAAKPIPMIELSPELSGELEDARTEPKAAAPPASGAPALAPGTGMPAAAVLHDEEMPVYAPLDRSADAAPVIPSNLNPNPRRAKPTRAPLVALGVVAALGALALALYLLFGAEDASVAAAPEAATRVGADAAAADLATAPPVAGEVADLRAAGEYAAACVAQRAYATALERAGAPPDTRASAAAALAELALLDERPAAAVDAQRDALTLRKAARGDDSPEAADEHLTIAGYYARVDQRHMAEAHYRQARAILRASPGARTDERARALRQLGDRLGVRE